jgi:hypothetical protein
VVREVGGPDSEADGGAACGPREREVRKREVPPEPQKQNKTKKTRKVFFFFALPCLSLVFLLPPFNLVQ